MSTASTEGSNSGHGHSTTQTGLFAKSPEPPSVTSTPGKDIRASPFAKLFHGPQPSLPSPTSPIKNVKFDRSTSLTLAPSPLPINLSPASSSIAGSPTAGRKRSFSASYVPTTNQSSTPKMTSSTSFPSPPTRSSSDIPRRSSPSPTRRDSAGSQKLSNNKRWYHPLQSILIPRDSAPPPKSVVIAPLTPAPPLRRKGDMICLNYDTLDDAQMLKLEGRSDHRPVMGDYAVYL